jgi:trk system potassium uptake protein
MILLYLGFICIGAGCTVLLPLIVLFFWHNEYICAVWYFIPGIAALTTGYIITVIAQEILKKEPSAGNGQLKPHQDSAVVFAAWIIAITVNALPFILSRRYSVSQAFFESVSGWTTTGLSVVDVENAPHILLMHRSIMLFFGGIGVILSVLFFLGGNGGLKLYTAEGHTDMLAPDVSKSARYIAYIYAGYIAGGTVLYYSAGMTWFDALNHSIAALSTGGFSTHSASIGYYHSVTIEIITIILMLLGSTNFLVHLYLLTGKWKNVFLYCETKAAAVILAVSIPFISFSVYLTLVPYAGHIPASVRVAIFQTVSALTTTGFQTIPTFSGISPFLLFTLTLLMLIGGGSGSTAGGIKQYRFTIACKDMFWTIRDAFQNGRIIQPHHIRRQESMIPAGQHFRREILSFIFIYMICFLAGTTILTAFGYPAGDCMFEMASALGTVGLSCGIMTADAPVPVLWTGSIAMFLGRVELYLAVFGSMRMVKDLILQIQTILPERRRLS